MGVKDENDRAREGSLPADPSTGTERVAPLRVVKPGEERRPDEPAALDSERALLAALLWCGTNAPDSLRVGAVADILESGESFYRPNSGAVYDAMRACSAAGAEHDPVAVHLQLVRSGRSGISLESLRAVMNDASTISERQARVYAEAIRDAWVRRNVIADAKQLIQDAMNAKTPSEELAEKARAVATAAAGRASDVSASFVHVNQAGIELVERMQKSGQTWMGTGLVCLDRAMNGGMRPGEVSIIAARTSTGKSLLSAQIAEHIVTSNPDLGVLYVTLEMRATALLARLLSARSGVPLSAIRRNDLTASQWTAFAGGMGSIHGKPLYFADNPAQTMAQVYSTAARCAAMLAKQGKKLSMVVIDHIGLVKPSAETAKRGSREQQVAETSRAQRFIANEFDCHVLGLAQIGREAEKNKDGAQIPKVHQLRESGSIEQDADSILILHRDKDAHGRFVADKPVALVLGKARSDETGVMLLKLDASQGKFSDWDGGGEFGDYY